MVTNQNKIPIAAQPSWNPNLDLIRCVAVLLVVTVHFFANSAYGGLSITGIFTITLTTIRTGCMVCVPLFALLSGYLCCRKTASAAYFKRIVPILVTYLITCVLSMLYRILLNNESYSLGQILLMILAFDDGAVQYGWYVEMYIGLYLLIPFLNLIYNNLPDKKARQQLLAIFLFLTVIPLEANSFDWLTPGFFRHPAVSTDFQALMPSWWTSLWPVTYYFIGAYIREYDIKIPALKNLLLFVGSVILFGLYECYRSWQGPLLWLTGSQWGGLQNTLNSVLLFTFLLHLDLSRLPGWCIAALRRISGLSFGIYLCSAISDIPVYNWLRAWDVSYLYKAMIFPLVVLVSFLLATLLAQVVSWIQALLFRAAGSALARRKNT